MTIRGTPATFGGHRIHQDGRRISGGSPRHVKTDRLDRRPARTELDPERIGEAIVLRYLPAVELLDPLARQGQRFQGARLAALDRGDDFRLGHPQACALEVELIEPSRVVVKRLVAARSHVGNDRAHGRLDVLRGLALGLQQSAEAFGEIACAGVEMDGHCLPCAVPDDALDIASRRLFAQAAFANIVVARATRIRSFFL